MTRIHYTSRANARPGRAYRGVPTAKLSATVELVPVTEGLTECPICHGGVKLIPAPYSDPEAGVSYQKTPVFRAHRTGGLTGGSSSTKCAGSHRLP